MSDALDRAATAYGIELAYVSETGEHRTIADDVKRALLAAMGVAAPEAEASALREAARGPTRRCYIPDWLRSGRAWGMTVQLYGVASRRNHGIGDFEDAARLAELFARLGADFLGINPVHALFSSDPERASPYFPSSRRFVNPLYIALDRLEGAAGALSPDEAEALRAGTHVAYARVAAAKRRALEHAFAAAGAGEDADFRMFCAEEGPALARFATFEALSERFAAEGQGPGWQGWPEPFRDPASAEVAAFAAASASRIRFHMWLQWIADRQLADVQRRARAAGMRIGLYLDLAVGVAPDGAATWCDRGAYAADARIGAPPDLFNARGQDWGLAPPKPSALLDPDGSVFARDLAAATRRAGAVRLDHAMALERLYWIPRGHDATQGGYVRYPFGVLVDTLAAASEAHRALVVGEDLGTVPAGFRAAMEAAGLLGCRVLYFEYDAEGRYLPPAAYQPEALAALATHDLPPLDAWWRGRDIAVREAVGVLDGEAAAAARSAREQSRRRLLEALAAEGLAPGGEGPGGEGADPDALAVAVHTFLARTPSRLLALQLEDLTGAAELVNLPGTDTAYPNWRLRLPLALEDLAAAPRVRRTVAAMARERPRSPP